MPLEWRANPVFRRDLEHFTPKRVKPGTDPLHDSSPYDGWAAVWDEVSEEWYYHREGTDEVKWWWELEDGEDQVCPQDLVAFEDGEEEEEEEQEEAAGTIFAREKAHTPVDVLMDSEHVAVSVEPVAVREDDTQNPIEEPTHSEGNVSGAILFAAARLRVLSARARSHVQFNQLNQALEESGFSMDSVSSHAERRLGRLPANSATPSVHHCPERRVAVSGGGYRTQSRRTARKSTCDDSQSRTRQNQLISEHTRVKALWWRAGLTRSELSFERRKHEASEREARAAYQFALFHAMDGIEQASVKQCMVSGKRFGLRRRRCICGRCGRVVSSEYSKTRMDKVDGGKRICDDCVISEYGYLLLPPGELKNSVRALRHPHSFQNNLNMAGKNIGAGGALHIAQALAHNEKVNWLSLEKSNIGSKGAQYIAEALFENKAVATLNLSGNHIGDEGAWFISQALRENTTVSWLKLDDNGITSEGAAFLADALAYNKSSLTHLSLGHNHIGTAGAVELATALETNKSVATLCLESNSIGQDGVRVMCEAILRKGRGFKFCASHNGLSVAQQEALSDIGFHEERRKIKICLSGPCSAAELHTRDTDY